MRAMTSGEPAGIGRRDRDHRQVDIGQEGQRHQVRQHGGEQQQRRHRATNEHQTMNFKEDVPSLREGSLYKTIDAGIFSKEGEKIIRLLSAGLQIMSR